MTQEEKLWYFILLEQNGGGTSPELNGYSRLQILAQTAKLIASGFITGTADTDSNGNPISIRKGKLTETGLQLFRKLELKAHELFPNMPSSITTMNQMTIFISHSADDVRLAGALVNLLRNALNIPADKIRCTSLNGYRLPVGADTEDQLRNEVLAASVFIGLITASSIASAYVMFELGARWGAKKYLVPLLGMGAGTNLLRGPLVSLNALKCDDSGQMHQLVYDLAKQLAISQSNPAAYQGLIDDITKISKENPKSAVSAAQLAPQKKETLVEILSKPFGAEKATANIEQQVPAITFKRSNGLPPPKLPAGISPTHFPKTSQLKAQLEPIEQQILMLFVNIEDGILTKKNILAQFALHRFVAERYIDNLLKYEYMQDIDDVTRQSGLYEITKAGRNYLIDHNLLS